MSDDQKVLSVEATTELVDKIATLQQEVARLRGELESAGAKTYSEMERLSQGWKAAESSLLALREALTIARREMQRDLWDVSFNPDQSSALDAAESALSTTSAQAEGIKARWQAEALRDAATEIRMTMYDRVQIVAYMNARAAQLTAKTGEGK